MFFITNKFFKNFFLLLDLKTKIKENNNNPNKNFLISNEIILIRNLHLIYSLDKNKKNISKINIQKINLFYHFIKIGDYKSSKNYYEKFTELFNKLTYKKIIQIKKTINSINLINNNNIRRDEILKMIKKGEFGLVYKIKKNSNIFAMKIIEIKQFLNIKEIINNKKILKMFSAKQKYGKIKSYKFC